MPGLKDFMKKAKELAEKGVSMVKEAMTFEQLMKDFDEVVANTLSTILAEHGYRGMGQEEVGDYYVVKFAIDDFEKVKHIVDRDIRRRYSPKDREKILDIYPDYLEFRINYTRKHAAASSFLTPVSVEDVKVSSRLFYFVERKGGFLSKVKKDRHDVNLGGFSFKSSDFVKYDVKEIDYDKLKEYLESKLKTFGII